MKHSLRCVAIKDVLPSPEGEAYPPSSDYATKNYPPPGDSTYYYFFCNAPLVADIEISPPVPLLLLPATSSGGRRTGTASHPDGGQQPSGGSGRDLRGRQEHEVPPEGRDPPAESLDTREEAAEALAARFRASRERLHEAHGSGVDFVGA